MVPGLMVVKGPSVAGRALLAVGLMIGFYLLAIGIAGGLLFLCYAMVAWADRIPIKLLLIMVISACAILWSIVPRLDRFLAPGPQLTREKHPKLFAELESVAQATGQAMPVEVYLISDVNAWVTQRGGIMGLGSRRVMGVGLALMRVLTVSEFRAVLAHEFGHFYGGDTHLGPWVYKTRGAIGRTIMSLGGSMLQKPFLWYGNMFLRVTHAVSRRQEFTADRLAAVTMGKEPLASGLRKTHGAGLAFEPFWRSEMVPVLASGFCPPMAEGFARFMESAEISSAMDKAVDEEMKEERKNPYDTHPPLRQRIAAVADVPALGMAADGRPAIVLLEDVEQLERSLLATIASPETVRRLAAAKWDEMAERVWIPIWRKGLDEQRKMLTGMKPENLGRTAVVTTMRGTQLKEDDLLRMQTVGAALTLAAVDAGGTLSCELGAPVTVERSGVRVELFSVLQRLAKGELTDGEWENQCDVLGITGVDLARVGIVKDSSE